VSAAWYSLPKPAEPHDAVEMGKQLSPAGRSGAQRARSREPHQPRRSAARQVGIAFSSERTEN
jgi:hypothetical protein